MNLSREKIDNSFHFFTNLVNACFKEPTPDKIGRVLFAWRALKVPLRAQPQSADWEPQYLNFIICPKTSCLDQKKILRKIANKIFWFLLLKWRYNSLIFKFWWPAVMILVMFFYPNIVFWVLNCIFKCRVSNNSNK